MSACLFTMSLKDIETMTIKELEKGISFYTQYLEKNNNPKQGFEYDVWRGTSDNIKMMEHVLKQKKGLIAYSYPVAEILDELQEHVKNDRIPERSIGRVPNEDLEGVTRDFEKAGLVIEKRFYYVVKLKK